MLYFILKAQYVGILAQNIQPTLSTDCKENNKCDCMSNISVYSVEQVTTDVSMLTS